jgi:hypothetical protein
MIDLATIAASAGAPAEHPAARRVLYVLAMREWRARWRRAEAAGDTRALDRLDREFEIIHGA